MNFDYIKEAEPSTDDLRQLYDSLYQNLEKAEELYWTKPQRCGMMLRKATEKICRIYNGYYEINFPESATLEEYLCYTGDDDHNAMVSRFLSVVRKEQMENVQGRSFADDILPGYQSEEELEALEEQRQKEQRKSFWSSLFGKKEK